MEETSGTTTHYHKREQMLTWNLNTCKPRIHSSSYTLQAPQANRKASNTAQADTLFGLTGHSNGHSTRLKRIFTGAPQTSAGSRGTRTTFMRRFRLA